MWMIDGHYGLVRFISSDRFSVRLFLLLFGKGFVCVLNTLHLNENLLSSARANKSVFYSLRLHTVVNIGGTSDVYFGL